MSGTYVLIGGTGITGSADDSIKLEDSSGNVVDTVEVNGIRRFAVDVSNTSPNDFLSKISSNDTTAGYLEDKIVAGSAKISVNTLNEGGNEDLELDINESSIDHNALTNYEAAEHIDWSQAGAGTIHSSNYVDNDTTDHTALSNIGTNTHAQIDTHIADSTVHFTEGSIDHGNIGGLTDDDHTQYVLLAGRAGGQSLIGGTAASDDMTIESTSNATKGDIILQPNGGDVGVGTSIPRRKLHLHSTTGNSEIAMSTASTGSGPTDGAYFGILDSNQEAYFWNYENGHMAFGTNNTRRMTIRSSGDVGIGTASPGADLHIREDKEGNTTSVRVQNSATSAGSSASFYILGGSNYIQHLAYANGTTYSISNATAAYIIGTYAASDVRIFTNTTERIRVNSSGNMGVGVTSPTVKLHVDGPVRVAQYTVATVPSASSSGAGAMIYVSDESGGAVMAFSDGSDWRRTTDRAIIS